MPSVTNNCAPPAGLWYSLCVNKLRWLLYVTQPPSVSIGPWDTLDDFGNYQTYEEGPTALHQTTSHPACVCVRTRQQPVSCDRFFLLS